MSVFFSYKSDPGLDVDDVMEYNGSMWIIVGLRTGVNGVWMELEGYSDLS